MARWLVLTIFLGGCAAMTENQCKVGDWYALGQQEGVLGLRPRIDQYSYECPRYSVTPSEPAYMAGWADGNSEYNTRVGGSKM